MKPFVFLDRDGTLIVERHYLDDSDRVELIAGAGAALRHLREAGFGVAVITNQSGIGRGYFGWERVEAIHQRMRDLLAADDAVIDSIFVCPHLPEEGCACRKPGVALIAAAAHQCGADLEASFIIGDKESDIDCGRNARLTTILVRTGYGSSLRSEVAARADFVAADLPAAVEWILKGGGRRSGSQHRSQP